MHLKMTNQRLSFNSDLCCTLCSFVVVLGAFSYGPIQVRIADSMLAVVPLLGLAGVLGHTLGVFVGNVFSPAGPIDF